MPRAATRATRGLSRRESQILDILHARGAATAAEVQAELPESPGYNSVRKLLEILEKRGVVRHTMDGRRFVYSAVTPKTVARKSALQHLVRTFFDGSAEQAAVALLAMADTKIDAAAIDRIARASGKARSEGR
jgi:predicted transcriptional regulator